MNHIKLFEELNIGEPQIDDYVICKDLDVDNSGDYLNFFLLNNIGKFIRLSNNYDVNVTSLPEKYKYMIQYDNVPCEFEEDFHFGEPRNNDCRIMKREEILFWSKDKKDLESIITANKYNL